MNYLDILIIIPLVWAIFKGFRKGFIIELASLVALFVGVFAGIYFSDFAAELLIKHFNVDPHYTKAIAFLLILIGVIIIVHLIAKSIEKIINLTLLGIFNKIAGAVFSLLKTAFIISIIFFIFSKFDSNENIITRQHKEKSLLYNTIYTIAPTCIPLIKKEMQKFQTNQNTNKEKPQD